MTQTAAVGNTAAKSHSLRTSPRSAAVRPAIDGITSRVASFIDDRVTLARGITNANRDRDAATVRIAAARTALEDALATNSPPDAARAALRDAEIDAGTAEALAAGTSRRLAAMDATAPDLSDTAARDLANAAAPIMARLDAEYREARDKALAAAGRLAAVTSALAGANTARVATPPLPAFTELALPPTLLSHTPTLPALLQGIGAAYGVQAIQTDDAQALAKAANTIRALVHMVP